MDTRCNFLLQDKENFQFQEKLKPVTMVTMIDSAEAGLRLLFVVGLP